MNDSQGSISEQLSTSTDAGAPIGVLVFSKTSSYRHASIPAGIAAIQQLAIASTTASAPLTVTTSEDASLFTVTSLARFRVLVLLQTSGDFLNAAQLAALKSFVRGGGGVVGIHCASFGMPTREVDIQGWYGTLIGAAFADHPEPQAGVVRVVDPKHVVLSGGATAKAVREGCWSWFDEWYNFKDNPKENGAHVLLEVDEESYQGGTMGEQHAVAWCHEFEGGRCFYTALGHFDEAYEDETFMAQVLNGILWAARLI